MVYDKILLENARKLFQKAKKRNLMGRFNEAREIAVQAIGMIEPNASDSYFDFLSYVYYFLGDTTTTLRYLAKEIRDLEEGRRRYGKTDEAYHYGSRYLDAHIDMLRGKSFQNSPKIGTTSTLVVFDLDGTLLQMNGYSWDYLSRMLGVNKEEEKKLEEEYKRRDIDYREWAGKVLALYKRHGIKKRHLDELIRNISIAPGAIETIEELKKRGKKIALISGSLDYLADAFFPKGTFDYVHINRIFFDSDGNLIGWETTPYGDGIYKYRGLHEICEPKTIINYKRKPNFVERPYAPYAGMFEPDDDGLEKLVTREPGHLFHRTVFVGDNDNDYEIAEAAGMAIAVNSSSEKLKSVCEISVNGDLRGILEYIG